MDYLNSNNGRKRKENEMKTIVAIELLNKILKVLPLAKSSYFYNLNKERYGYRRIQMELEKQGININHKKFQRLMSEMYLKGKIVKQNIIHI